MSGRTIHIHASETGSWQVVRGAPGAAVRGFVQGAYAGWTETAVPAVTRREVPALFIPVIVNFAEPFAIATADGPLQARSSFMAGAHDRHTLVRSAGRCCCLQFDLTFDGARRLFGMPMRQLANCTVTLDDALGGAGRRLAERLGNARGWPERFDLLDRFLVTHLHSHPGLSPIVAFALPRLPGVSAGMIAAELGISRKRLIAAFHDGIGLTPKTLARVHRFGRALSLLHRRRDLAAVALDCGYYDQAHFNRDFRDLTGISPLAYLAERHLSKPDRQANSSEAVA